MATSPTHIVIKLSTKNPIELEDFLSVFTAVQNQYEKFIKEKFPEVTSEARIFVKEIKRGSIIADLLPFVPHVLTNMAPLIAQMDQVLIIEEFVRKYGGRLRAYFKKNGKLDDASKSDLKDFMGAVASVAKDPKANCSVEAVYFEDGKRKVKAAVKFSSRQAFQASKNIEAQRNRLDKKGAADHQRVLMVFHQSNVKDTVVGKRTGEWVVVEKISDKELPLIYASELAEKRIKHEIREADDNVYKKGFIVDVNAEIKGGKIVGYRVTNLHQVIDLP